MSELEMQVRKFMGLKPYHDTTNYLVGDGYLKRQIIKDFGEEEYKAMVTKLEGEKNEQSNTP